MVVDPRGWHCTSMFNSAKRGSTPSALQPSLTHRRLFKIMCWGIFTLPQSILPFQPAAGWVEASLDWLPNETIGYNPSPEVARDKIKTFLPSSLIPHCHWWVSGNNYQTRLYLLFIYLFIPLSCSAGKMVSLLMCLWSLAGFSLYDTKRQTLTCL